MKALIKTLIITAFLFLSTNLLQAQAPPHPNNGVAPNSGGSNNKPVGGGAPITDGPFILMALGMAYAGRKWHEAHKKKVESPA